MASGPYPDARRGTWSIQWWNGRRWTRTTVTKKRAGWKPGDPMPKTPPPEAKAALAEFVAKEDAARKRKGYHPDRTIKDFLQSYLDGYEISREPGSKIEAKKAVDVFLGWCEANRVRRVAEVTPQVAHRWINDRALTRSKRTGEMMAFATLKKERALLATAWSEALRRGMAESNPWVNVEVPGKPSRKERGSWSPAQFEQLLAVCNPWLRDLLTVGCHTGMRVEALRGLEWRDVLPPDSEKAEYGYLAVRPELDKTGRGYRVPIHVKVNEVLIRRRIHHRGEHNFILAGLRGGPIKTTSLTDRAIVRACERAKLNRPDSPNHHMRRTFGRWAVLGHLTGRPVPMYVVSEWLGHSSIQMTQAYLAMSESDSSAWMSVDGWMTSPSV